MKNKFRFLFAFTFFVFLARTGNCQVVNYFIDGSRWVYETTESIEPNIQVIHNTLEQFTIQGDTIINLVSYKKLFNKKIITTITHPTTMPTYTDSYDTSLHYIRFDSVANEVYYRTDTSSTDMLVYSFSPAQGDTLTGIYAGINYIADSIEQINLFGVQTPKYLISEPPPWNYINPDNYLIDGVGGSNGLLEFYPVQIVLSGGVLMTRLICFQHMDSILLGFNRIDCPYVNFPTSIDEIQEDIHPTIYPNPFGEDLKISINKFISNGQIEIFDAMGRKVYADGFTGNFKTVNCNLPSGMYLIQIKGHGIYFSQKIFRE